MQNFKYKLIILRGKKSELENILFFPDSQILILHLRIYMSPFRFFSSESKFCFCPTELKTKSQLQLFLTIASLSHNSKFSSQNCEFFINKVMTLHTKSELQDVYIFN